MKEWFEILDAPTNRGLETLRSAILSMTSESLRSRDLGPEFNPWSELPREPALFFYAVADYTPPEFPPSILASLVFILLGEVVLFFFFIFSVNILLRKFFDVVMLLLTDSCASICSDNSSGL